ncbi:MAG: RsmE family RNA methyltransferase, partial [bacterium]
MSADRLRLFYTASSLVAGDTARIEGEEAAHLARSLRMKPGDRCRIATEEGEEFIAELTAVSPGAAEGKIIERLGRRPPSPLSISLGLPLIKGERFEWVLEKGAELGVDAFFPLALARCEVRISENKAAG